MTGANAWAAPGSGRAPRHRSSTRPAGQALPAINSGLSRPRPAGIVLIPDDSTQAIVHCTARTPTRPSVRGLRGWVEPVGSDGPDDFAPT